LVSFLNVAHSKGRYFYLAGVEGEIVSPDQEREVIFETKVVVTGWKFKWAMRSRKLRITNSEILIENLPPIPLVSITSCKIRFSYIQVEFVDKHSATRKLMIRAPLLKYYFREFPANYMDEHEFVENLFDAITEAIPEESAFWSSLKDARKELNTNKIAEIKRDYAKQVRRKRILSLVLLPLTFLWVLFIVTQILHLISLDEYERFGTFVFFLIFPIMFGLAFLTIKRCPYCKALFINTPKFCRKCRVPLIDEDNFVF
jgi:hypothetical protein